MDISIDLLAAVLAETDTDHWRRRSHHEQARYITAALSLGTAHPGPRAAPPGRAAEAEHTIEEWVCRAERHDLAEDEQHALQSLLTTYGLSGGTIPSPWGRALGELIAVTGPTHRRALARAFPDWIVWAEALETPGLRQRLLAAVDNA
ncbi:MULTISPECIES: hypothetical protein [Pseudonocardia]|uniref:Uncharacterized protein n=1 Tax=Pseudonocardia alni TaxID=33907 RepID=A0A852W813_PSEA5|nr:MULTISPECIES: hypothetical protein [Pseudonocardia]MCO7192192.1 hypothetical protein [Pseudonocardia sp. McavD-2-B]NYG05317.1 hypothetical protein [Pseudonocardia antarctica]PKB41347.1 hypothetical protein ATL51_0009 [Pseudonocardia alni]